MSGFGWKDGFGLASGVAKMGEMGSLLAGLDPITGGISAGAKTASSLFGLASGGLGAAGGVAGGAAGIPSMAGGIWGGMSKYASLIGDKGLGAAASGLGSVLNIGMGTYDALTGDGKGGAFDTFADGEKRVTGGLKALGGGLSLGGLLGGASLTGAGAGGAATLAGSSLGAIAAGGAAGLATAGGAVISAGLAGYGLGTGIAKAGSSDYARRSYYGQGADGKDRTLNDVVIDGAVAADQGINSIDKWAGFEEGGIGDTVTDVVGTGVGALTSGLGSIAAAPIGLLDAGVGAIGSALSGW